MFGEDVFVKLRQRVRDENFLLVMGGENVYCHCMQLFLIFLIPKRGCKTGKGCTFQFKLVCE